MDTITRESVLAEVRDQLLRSVRSPEQRDVVSRWFAANESLCLLAIANALDILNFRAVQRAAQRETAKQRPPRPALPNEATFSFVDELGKEITLNSDDPDGELIEKLRQWIMALEPGQLSVWEAELVDSAHPDDKGTPLLQAVRGISQWHFDAHFGNRKGPKIWSPAVDPLYETLWENGYVDKAESHAYTFRLVTAFLASLVCPNPQILGRADYGLLEALAACAANLEHARQAAGWDYRPAIQAAAYDALHARYQRKLTAREKWLTDKRRACLDHRPLGPVFFAAFTSLYTFSDLDTEKWWRVSRFVGTRADHTIPGQGLLSVVEPDTAESVFFEAIAAEWPALKPFICLEGEEDDPC